MLTPSQLPKEETTPVPADQSQTTAPDSADLTKVVTDNTKHIKYVPVSNACGYDLGTVIPKGMAQETYNALLEVKRQLEENLGLDLDGYVQDRLKFTPEELGIDRKYYDSLDDAGQKQIINDNLCTVFAPEQIDAIALAIYNIEFRKQGMIVGDMTGIGKGRIAAAIIRYCIVYLGKIPIFLTEKTYLFSDIFRDIIDISSDINVPLQIKTGERKKEMKLNKAQIASLVKEYMDNGDTREEAEEKIENQMDRGFIMEPTYTKNKEYETQVRKAKKRHLQIIPFILNNDGPETRVKNLNGDILYHAQRNADEDFKSAINKGKILPGYNLIMATYSQLRGAFFTKKMNWFLQQAIDTVVICDESHNASGASNTGNFLLQSLANSRGAIFLSATYAKRADNMVIYGAKTSISETGLPKEDLIAAIEKGGVPLQEIISSQLVAEGQMIRRERTYAGVNVLYNVLDASMELTGHPEFDLSDKHKAIADVFTKILRDIIDLQRNYIGKWAKLEDVAEKYLEEAYGEVEIPRGYDVQKTLSSSPMFSRVFNVINQLLFSIKSEAIADRAIDYMKQGKKPVITFANTMESFLDDLTNDEGEPLKDGDVISSDFKLVLEKLLDSAMNLTIKSPTGEKTKVKIPLDELPLQIQQFYLSIKSSIKNVSIGISISPIDVILKKVRDAGFVAEEITGRAGKMVFSDDSFMYARYERRMKVPATDTFRGFNQNKIDCLLINQSGATGGSIQALPNQVVNKVRIKKPDGTTATVPYVKNMPEEIVIPDSLEPKDEIKQRVMIILQPELNINTEVQKRGRIFRSGQVLPPMYEYMCSAIPAEKRLQMMLQKKLHSLDANTSSNQKQSDNLINIVDFLNKIGDQLVVKYLIENQPMIHKLGDPLGMIDSETKEIHPPTDFTNAAHRVSGRVAVLSISDQEKFYTEMSERYTDQVKLLKSTGDFDLEVEYYDLQATAMEKDIFIVGTGGKSLFGRNTIIEKTEVNNLRKPYTSEELELMITEELQEFSGFPNPAKQHQRSILDAQEKNYNERQASLVEDYKRYEENSISRIEKDEKYIKLAAKNAAEAEKWLNTMKTSIIAKNKEDLLENQADFEKKYRYVRDYLKKISVGMVTAYVKGEVKVPAIVIGIDIDYSKWNPYTPGNIRIKLAVSNGVRAVSVPLTNSEFINSIIAASEDAMSTPGQIKAFIANWTKLTKSSTADRIIRYIVTGNILQAMGNESVAEYGRLVKFTTDKKTIRNGILMMQEFDISKTADARGGAFVMVPARFCMPILDLIDVHKGTRYITTDDIEFTKDKNDLDFIVKVQKRDKETKNFVTDEAVLAFVNEKKGFADMGSIQIFDKETLKMANLPALGATIDRDRMPEFLEYLSKVRNSNFRIAKAVFEEQKALLGIDPQTDYNDGQELNESESGLSEVQIDIDNPLYEGIVEAQQDPVSEAGKQVEVVEEPATPKLVVVEQRPTVDEQAPVLSEIEKERANISFERKLMKLYAMLLPFEPKKEFASGGSIDYSSNWDSMRPDVKITFLKNNAHISDYNIIDKKFIELSAENQKKITDALAFIEKHRGDFYAQGGSTHGSGLGIYTMREKIRNAFETAGLPVEKIFYTSDGYSLKLVGDTDNVSRFLFSKYLPGNVIYDIKAERRNRQLPPLSEAQIKAIEDEFNEPAVMADFENGGSFKKYFGVNNKKGERIAVFEIGQTESGNESLMTHLHDAGFKAMPITEKEYKDFDLGDEFTLDEFRTAWQNYKGDKPQLKHGGSPGSNTNKIWEIQYRAANVPGIQTMNLELGRLSDETDVKNAIIRKQHGGWDAQIIKVTDKATGRVVFTMPQFGKGGKLAKYGIFKVSESGADSLLRARDKQGKPFKDRAEANAYFDEYIKSNKEFEGQNIVIRAISNI